MAIDAVAGARASVGVATVLGVVCVDAAVLGATDVDPQAMTASMVTRPNAIRNW